MSAATAQAQPDAKQNAVDTTCVYLNPDQTVAFYTGTETGTVTIEGCGTGEITLEFEGTLPPDGSSETSTARVQPGKSTGDLKGVSGTLTSTSTLNPDRSADGTLTGELHCPGAKKNP